MPEDQAQAPSLPEFLAERARKASDGRLALDAAVGLVLATGAAAIRPGGWVTLGSAGACLAAFGFWGIADRELSERKPALGPVGIALFQSARVVAVALGVMAGLILIFGTLAVTLGTWIS